MKRYGWKNKIRPALEQGGIYEIFCPHCEKRLVFLTNKKRVRLQGFPEMEKLLYSKYFLAKQLKPNGVTGFMSANRNNKFL